MKSLEMKISLCIIAIYMIQETVAICVSSNSNKRVDLYNTEQFILHKKQLLIAYMTLCGQKAMFIPLDEIVNSCDVIMRGVAGPITYTGRLEGRFDMLYHDNFFLSSRKNQTSFGNVKGDNTVYVEGTDIADVSLSKIPAQDSFIKIHKKFPINRITFKNLYRFFMRKINVVSYFIYYNTDLMNHSIVSQ